MNFTKIKKAVSAGIAAVMCVTMALSVPAAAATNTAYKNAKALTNATYNSNYIKWVEKYSAKKSSKTISFSKSKTKKFYEDQAKKISAKKPQYSMDLINSDAVVSVAVKTDKMKVVMYMKEGKEELSLAMYVDKKNMTMLSPAKKKKLTVPLPDGTDVNALIEDSLSSFDNDVYMSEDLGIADNAKGKYVKFTNDNKTYYYEEFETNNGKVGFLFNSKGKPLAITTGDVSLCLKFSYTVADSEVTVPKGYTEAGEDDLEDFFGNFSF